MLEGAIVGVWWREFGSLLLFSPSLFRFPLFFLAFITTEVLQLAWILPLITVLFSVGSHTLD